MSLGLYLGHLVSQNNVIITDYILAILGSDKVCEYLLRLEVPVATYTTYGSTPMEQILLNVPDVAEKALDQYIFRSEQINSKLYYINCLTTRRWQQLSTLKKKQRERRMYPTVLEVDSSYILHCCKMIKKDVRLYLSLP